MELLMDATIDLARDLYAEDIKKYNVYKTKTPARQGTVLTKPTDEEHNKAKHLPYQQLVGTLMWICNQCKIEASTILSMLGGQMAKWSEEHYKQALTVLVWFDNNKLKGLTYHRSEDFDPSNCIYAFADADLAGDKDTRRSRSGKIIMFGSGRHGNGTCVSHRSALQKIINLSTTAAEIVSLMETVTDVVGCRLLLKEFGYEQKEETKIYEDNLPAIALVEEERRVEGATKHTEMRHLKLRELMRAGKYKLTWCKTTSMIADIFTKNLPSRIFHAFADYLTGRMPQPPNTSEEIAVIAMR